MIDWADADHTGDVLLATDGCLHRIAAPDLMGGQPRLVADLNGAAFTRVKARPDALA